MPSVRGKLCQGDREVEAEAVRVYLNYYCLLAIGSAYNVNCRAADCHFGLFGMCWIDCGYGDGGGLEVSANVVQRSFHLIG